MIEPDGAWATSGDSSAVATLSKTLWDSDTISMPGNDPVRDKYEFTGWTDGNGKTYEASKPITLTGNLTITAQWKKVQLYTVKYAVRLYGIQQDVGENGNKLGLTFGPAGGRSYISTYKSYTPSAGQTCLHDMTWDEIIDQSINNPHVFDECLANGCTHSVDLMIKGSPVAGKDYKGKMDKGDGAGTLMSDSINTAYRRWNDNITTTGGWKTSKIRNTLSKAKPEKYSQRTWIWPACPAISTAGAAQICPIRSADFNGRTEKDAHRSPQCQ